MKTHIKLLCAILLFAGNVAFSANPNWERGVRYQKHGKYSKYLWAPKDVTVSGNMTVFCYDDLENSIFDYDLMTTARLSKMFNIEAGIASRNFEKYPDSFVVGLVCHPTSFFSFWNEYRARIFPAYKTAEHNIITMTDFYVDLTKWVDFHVLTGLAFSFCDMNTADALTVYKQDWLFYMKILYELRLMVHPVGFFSFGTSLGNYESFEVNTLTAWRCDTILEFYPSESIAIHIKFSVTSAGSLPFSGYIDRLALTIGGRYAIKII